MVQVSYPGVYIQEVPSGVHTVTSVSTSIAAFIGRTASGPLNKAVRCTNPSDFVRTFGGSHPENDLAQSVQMFFDNGGTDCYVIRIAHNASKANITLKNLTSIDVLTATAKFAGLLGNSIRLAVDYNCSVNPHDAFNLSVIQEDGGVVQSMEVFSNLNMDPKSSLFAPEYVTQNSNIIDLEDEGGSPGSFGYSESRRVFDTSKKISPADNPGSGFLADFNTLLASNNKLEISVNGERYIHIDLPTSIVTASTTASGVRNAVKNGIEGKINSMLGDAISGLAVTCSWEVVDGDNQLLRIQSSSGDNSSVRIKPSAENDFAGPMMMGTDQGGIELSKYAELRPAATGTFLDLSNMNTVAWLEQKDFDEVTLGGVSVSLGSSLQTTGAADRWFKDGIASSITGNSDGVREKLKIIAEAVNSDTNVKCHAEVWGYQLAFIPTDGTVNNLISIATSGGDGEDINTYFSKNVRLYTLGNTGSSSYQNIPGVKGLDDDGNPLEESNYAGSELEQTGIHALDVVDLFNLMVIPDDRESTAVIQGFWGKASTYCQKRRAFLLVDPPSSWTTQVDGTTRPHVKDDTALINSLRLSIEKDHAAVCYPNLIYKSNGLMKKIGPSGAIAGLMARIDSARGVWKSPAGIEAGLRSIVGLEVELTDAENGILNKKGVNCIRAFPNGIVNWGGRTLDGDDDFGSEWKYISVRRLALMIEESLFRGTKWAVFEGNDEPLWAQIRMNLGAYMNSLFRQGAFQGSSPKEAYYVKCDKETTTQNDINQGIVNIEVGFAPLKPAEFVVIKIQQMSGEL